MSSVCCVIMPSTSTTSFASRVAAGTSNRKYPVSDTSSVDSYSSGSSDLSTETLVKTVIDSYSTHHHEESYMSPAGGVYEYGRVTSPSRSDRSTADSSVTLVGSDCYPYRYDQTTKATNIPNGNANGYQSRNGKQAMQPQPQQQQQTQPPNGKQGRFNARRSPNYKKNRHYSSSMVQSTSLYPCSLCCYGYPQLVDYSNPRNRGANFRNRSFSASQTSLHSDNSAGQAPSVLSLAECAYLYTNYRKRSSLYNLTSDDFDMLTIGQREFDLHDPRFDVLSFDQVQCLSSVLEQTIKIKSDHQTELVEFPLLDLILGVKRLMLEKDIVIYDIRLNGGAASHVLSMSASVYNDIDLIFFVDLNDGSCFERVREAVLEVMVEYVPIIEKRHVIETFVNKMVKVNDPDNRWSLISLLNFAGRNVELKFVDKMRRQYEFSVDSFQIVLDTLLQFFQINSGKHPMTINFYPTVVGESMYGNFCEAMVHLHHHLIVTKNPEEIRGGGLLKYCSLLVRNFHPIDDRNAKVSEPYMCTRFLIDFIYYDFQKDKLHNYLTTHFGDDSLLKYNFMITFFAIVRRSSSLANHHASQMIDFEKLTLDCYSKVLTEYLDMYLTDPNKVHDFFQRCQDMRVCHCPKSIRACIHRYLNPVYSLTSPLVVTFVDDTYDESVTKSERKQNLDKFIELHDEMIPIYGGFTFAYLPSVLFDCVESNHYVVSSSTLKSIPSARYIEAQPQPPTDYMCTFLMKPGSGPQPMMQIIPLGVQNMLPKSFYPVDYHNPNIILPSMAYHFFPPMAPPHQYRLCIVNRIPVYSAETIASGPIYQSQIMAMAFANTTEAPGEAQPVSLSQFKLSPLYAHVHNHTHHHHGAHHQHGHGAQHHHHQHQHHHQKQQQHNQHNQPNNGYPIYSQYAAYQNGGPNRPKKVQYQNQQQHQHHTHQHGHHAHTHPVHHYQSQMSAPAGFMSDMSCGAPVEPLRIVYPRPPGHEANLAQALAEQNGTEVKEVNGTSKSTTTSKLSIPQISINDHPINLTSDLDQLTEQQSHKQRPPKSSSAANGTSGTITNGTITKGTIANGIITNGTVTNGTVTKGTITNGSITNGIATKGTIINGTIVNGIATKGTIINGTIVNGNNRAGNPYASSTTTPAMKKSVVAAE